MTVSVIAIGRLTGSGRYRDGIHMVQFHQNAKVTHFAAMCSPVPIVDAKAPLWSSSWFRTSFQWSVVYGQ